MTFQSHVQDIKKTKTKTFIRENEAHSTYFKTLHWLFLLISKLSWFGPGDTKTSEGVNLAVFNNTPYLSRLFKIIRVTLFKRESHNLSVWNSLGFPLISCQPIFLVRKASETKSIQNKNVTFLKTLKTYFYKHNWSSWIL